LLETMASVVAVALERIHYAELAKTTEVRMASETLRSTILSALSHDLRTPLTALVGMADTLAEGRAAEPEKQRAMILAIRDQGLTINRLVSNLLEMARLQSGAVTLNKEWQPVEEVIGASLQQVRLQLDGHPIKVEIMPLLPPIEIDAVLMERALCNLLENAAKYSPPGTGIDLSARQMNNWLEIAVCDRGPGLPKGSEAEIFGLFRRGQRESNIPGVGLGLAIVRTIVEAHGGSVDADNRSDGGACFRLRLPMGAPPHVAELEAEA
jgi:two-component system sensor histidine kinase KdpD